MTSPTVITLGCRLNAVESDIMRHHAGAAGLDDAVIVNTCAVTGEAVRRAGQTIRRIRRERPGARIIVTGCAAQVEPERFADMPEVDHVVGNAEKMRPETFRGLSIATTGKVIVDDIMSMRETAGHLLASQLVDNQIADGIGNRTRAFVQIQNGCDHRCTFCIIPFGRGPSRSVPAGEVVAQVRRLVEAGTKEIVLTGVDITSYGDDLPGETSLGRLVRQILRHVPELPRLRLSSIDQVEADPHLMDAIAEEDRLMPHLHLSMQAGDDLILKRMKRRHLRADAERFCATVRRLRPDVVLGADLIAGFPTETEQQFERTLDLVEDCGLVYLHVFPFSPRNGTPAARMPQVGRDVAKSRAARLRAKGDHALAAWLAGHNGRETVVLLERGGIGRTPQFAEVEAAYHTARAGDLIRVRIAASDGQRLSGEIIA